MSDIFERLNRRIGILGRQIAAEKEAQAAPRQGLTEIGVELPDGIWDDQDGRFWARCVSCEKTFEIDCSLDELLKKEAGPGVALVCGGSDRCLP